ncbi:hypothetical protein [Rivibacter subsaxonicus]|uniref:Uncharacterized protein n=1 Tax=Rivibacter subsaxonicus TaxID=457575 RepID=A0A4Q7VZW3_9BURK|nr:hypothetical protein [Rivibacter subsaxonicus]RZU02441.1 hypothetical protein EV670_0464 [Rivibacter subsaxonicus]
MNTHPPASGRDDDEPDWLESLLRAGAGEAIPDEGFVAALMRRVAATAVTAVPAAGALQALAARREQERRLGRWSLVGAGAGLVVAIACAAAAGGGASGVDLRLALAPMLAGLVTSIVLAAAVLLERA